MELYYAIMNIVDYMALHEVEEDELEKFISTLNFLQYMTGCDIRDIADANDCYADTWFELIDAIRELFETGERVPLRKEN